MTADNSISRRAFLEVSAFSFGTLFVPEVRVTNEVIYTPSAERTIYPDNPAVNDNLYGLAVSANTASESSPNFGEKLAVTLLHSGPSNVYFMLEILDSSNYPRGIGKNIILPSEWSEPIPFVECISIVDGYLVGIAGRNSLTGKYEIKTVKVGLNGIPDVTNTDLITNLDYAPERFSFVTDTINNRLLVVWQRDWGKGIGGRIVGFYGTQYSNL